MIKQSTIEKVINIIKLIRQSGLSIPAYFNSLGKSPNNFYSQINKISKAYNGGELSGLTNIKNLLSDYELYQKMGDKIWKYSKGTKEENSWLYKECYYIAKKKGASEWLLGRYKKILLEYFGDLDEESI